jgi:hypothetical protein
MIKTRSFWYITHLYNLGSILEHGILSRNWCKRLHIDSYDISDSGVQSRRSEFHDYVPLYFADNTPMLYNVFDNLLDYVILLEVNKRVIKYKDVKFSDGNVANIPTKIFSNVADLEDNLDWSTIYSREFPNLHREPWNWDWKRKKMAEVLVPNKVAVSEIKSIHVSSESTYNWVEKVVADAGLRIRISRDLTRQGITLID